MSTGTRRKRRNEPKEGQRGELVEKIVKIKRCAAVVKGGRRFSFAAMVVVGDGKGKVGWGYGKANEVPPSVEKAVKESQRSMVEPRADIENTRSWTGFGLNLTAAIAIAE